MVRSWAWSPVGQGDGRRLQTQCTQAQPAASGNHIWLRSPKRAEVVWEPRGRTDTLMVTGHQPAVLDCALRPLISLHQLCLSHPQ